MDWLLGMYTGMGIMAAYFGIMKFIGWTTELELARARQDRAIEELERRVGRLEGRKP